MAFSYEDDFFEYIYSYEDENGEKDLNLVKFAIDFQDNKYYRRYLLEHKKQLEKEIAMINNLLEGGQ
jgi:hypothetical protein